MSLIDVILIAVILAGIIMGARSGLIEQIASIVAILAAIVLTRIFGDDATRFLTELIPSFKESGETICSVVGHISLFILVYVLIRLFGGVFRKLFHSLKLGKIDRVLGAVFCVIKYCLLLSVILNIWLLLSPNSGLTKQSRILDGKVCVAVVKFAPWLLTSDFIPHSVDVVSGDA
ncbi:MAG: CvpA family protein [Muribaculaceae bacterium]|nr:CvpA family protein [Muribaculaceae bacterium]